MTTDAEWAVRRLAVEDLVARTAICIDKKDWDGLIDCYTDDAIVVYPYRGWEMEPRKWLAGAKNLVEPYEATQHFLSNFEIKIEGDQGRSRVYVLAQHAAPAAGARLLAADERAPRAWVGAVWQDDVRRTEDGWRIWKRTSEVRWVDADHVLGQPERPL